MCGRLVRIQQFGGILRIAPLLHVAHYRCYISLSVIFGIVRVVPDIISAVQPPQRPDLGILRNHGVEIEGSGSQRSVFHHLVPAHKGVMLRALFPAVFCQAVQVVPAEVSVHPFILVGKLHRAALSKPLFREGTVIRPVLVNLRCGQVQCAPEGTGNKVPVMLLADVPGIQVVIEFRFRIQSKFLDLLLVGGQVIALQEVVGADGFLIVHPETCGGAGGCGSGPPAVDLCPVRVNPDHVIQLFEHRIEHNALARHG